MPVRRSAAARAAALAAGLLAALLLALPAGAQSMSTPARAALVKDMLSGAVLLEKDADEPLPPASMSKLMTLYMVFEALESGRLRLDDTFRTSKYASSIGGSRMFIRPGVAVSVENLLRGVVVQSGNDAAVALAEALSGTEEAFAELMNRRAAEMGLVNSHFANATGWPEPGHVMSVRDLAILGERIILDFPELYKMFAETEFTWENIDQRNRNPLLYADIGADGLKTGHTEEAGYGLVASAVRDGRRVMMVVTGLGTQGERRRESERLVNWAFRAFDTKVLHAAGEPVIDADVWVGQQSTVPLAPVRDVILTAPIGQLEKARVTAHYDAPLPAPIAAGDAVGRIEIAVPGLAPVSVPLAATEAVAPGGFLVRMEAAAELLVRRAIDAAGF
ncbi:MAG: D-alanyl-D-alanine carboxypeptidase family protein [Pseudomonadota bacterium]